MLYERREPRPSSWTRRPCTSPPWRRLTLRCAVAALLGHGFGASATVDYDGDDDGLIEITALNQLNAVRWDLNGDGLVDESRYAATYQAAFPDAVAAMGCRAPTGAPVCQGYELGSNANSSLALDFATTDDYANGGAGWLPIGGGGGGFGAVFKGNGHAIRNLSINRATTYNVGLFSAFLDGAEVEGVRLFDVDVRGDENAGALVGDNAGTITASQASGSIRGRVNVGGLAGVNQGAIRESSATGSVSASLAVGGLVGRGTTGSAVAASYSASDVAGTEQVGGLVGRLGGSLTATYANGIVRGTRAVGGLAGEAAIGAIAASYASGAVSGTAFVGGLVGRAGSDPGPVVANSYWDLQTAGQRASAAGTARRSHQLREPTSATGIYAAWDSLALGEGDARDDPWHFGTAAQYPVLHIGSVRADEQRAVVARTVPAPLVEYMLDGATVQVTLPQGRSFLPTVGNADFALAAAPAGVVLGGVAARLSSDTVELTLSRLSTGAASGSAELSVTARATGHTASTDLTTTAIPVTPDAGGQLLVLDAKLLAVLAGSGAEYTVALATAPTAPVTVAIGTTGPISASPANIRFGADDWSTPQVVRVEADYGDCPRICMAGLLHTASGGDYEGLTEGLSVHVLRAPPGVSVSMSALTIDEGEETSYALRLNSRPDPDGLVMVTVAVDSEGVRVDPDVIAFDAENWNQPFGVVVKAFPDSDAEDGTATLTHAVVGYGEVRTGPSVAVTIRDDAAAAMLSALWVYPGRLAPEFDPAVNDYLAVVAADVVTVVAAASSPTATVAIVPRDISPLPGHQVNFAAGPSTVAVRVRNGARASVYMLRMVGDASRPPAVAARFSPVVLEVGATKTIDLRRGFRDPDGDPMAYAASIDRPELATVEVSGDRARIAGLADGDAMVIVSATDPAGLVAMQAVSVSVGDVSQSEP